MAAIGAGWAATAWIEAAWVTGAWAGASVTLTLPTETAKTKTTATIGATTDTASGTLYLVVTTSITAPSAAQIKLGQDELSVAADFADDQTPSAGANTFTVTGLAAAGTYYNYFYQEDGAVVSNVLGSGAWSTLSDAIEQPTGGEVETGFRPKPFTGKDLFAEIPGERPLEAPQSVDQPVTPAPITTLEPGGQAQAQADRRRELKAKRTKAAQDKESRARLTAELKVLAFLEAEQSRENARLEAIRLENEEDEQLLMLGMDRKRRLIGQYIAIKRQNESLQTQAVISGLKTLLEMIRRAI